MNEVLPGQSAFLYYLQMGLFEKSNLPKPVATDWKELFEESRTQAVHGIVFDGIQIAGDDDKLDDDLKNEWIQHIYYVISANEKLLFAQSVIDKIFKENGIDYVIMKGSSAAAAYRTPEMRTCGDIDVLVRNCDFEKSCGILKGMGYSSMDIYGGHHIQFKKNGVEVELHNRPGGLPDGKIGDDIGKYFENSIDDRVSGEIGSYIFPSFSVCTQGGSLLLHIVQHLQNTGIGFRQFCDYACFKHKYHDEIDERKLIELFNRFGIGDAARIIETFCNKFLDADECRYTEKDERTAKILLAELFDSGNFGVKKKDRNVENSKYLVRRYSSKAICDAKHNRLYNIYRASLTIHPFFTEHKIFGPAAFVIFGGRYLFRLITGKKSVKQIMAIMDDANKREVLLSELHIFEKKGSGD